MADAINFSAEVLISGDADAGDMVIKIVQVPDQTESADRNRSRPGAGAATDWRRLESAGLSAHRHPNRDHAERLEARLSDAVHRPDVQDQNHPRHRRSRHRDQEHRRHDVARHRAASLQFRPSLELRPELDLSGHPRRVPRRRDLRADVHGQRHPRPIATCAGTPPTRR